MKEEEKKSDEVHVTSAMKRLSTTPQDSERDYSSTSDMRPELSEHVSASVIYGGRKTEPLPKVLRPHDALNDACFVYEEYSLPVMPDGQQLSANPLGEVDSNVDRLQTTKKQSL